jgi:hypothetical protein
VGPRAGLDKGEMRNVLTLPGFELRPLGRSVRNQPLHRLSYPGSILFELTNLIPHNHLMFITEHL